VNLKLLIALLTASMLFGGYHILPNRSLAVEEWSLNGSIPVNALHVDIAAPSLVPEQTQSAVPTFANRAEQMIDKPASILDETVNKWKKSLAEQKGFENWDQAAWSSFTLGPGSHGWVVILNQDRKEVGYMIIHAAENGELLLTEYGTGSSPLFSFNTLYHSLVQLELIPHTSSLDEFNQAKNVIWERWYLGSLRGVWKITLEHSVYVLDAKTGEALPLDRLPAGSGEMLPVRSSLTGLLEEQLVPAFDPYERLSWVQGTPLPINQLEDLKNALNKNGKLTYVTERYEGKVTSAYAVLGYSKWEKDDPYLIVDQNGPSYVPLSSALAHGHIYP
jgi:hypothetical protein